MEIPTTDSNAAEQLSILIVEDERIVAEDLKETLKNFGYHVVAIAVSGEIAIERVNELHPELILMDIHLAGMMNGIEAAEMILKRHDLPLIFLTAFADKALVSRAKLAGPFGYILKPYDEQELRISIEIAIYKHKLEKTLKESEERYRGFVQNFLGIAFRLKPDFTPVFLHGAVETITGYTESEFKLSAPLWDHIIYGDDVSVVQKQNQKIQSVSDYSGSHEYRIVHKNGTVRWIYEMVQSIPDLSGSPQFIQGSRYDITERKNAEVFLKKMNEELEIRVSERTESLNQQLQFLQQMIDTLPSPIFYKNPQGHYIGCNNTFESYVGLSKKEIINKTDADLFPADLAEFSHQKDVLLLKNRGIQVYQSKFMHADHTIRDVIFKRATFNDTHGNIGGLIGVLLDITDRIRVEEALKESEQRFRGVVHDQTELIYRYRTDRTLLFANEAFLKYFYTTAKDPVGYIFRLHVHPDDEVKVTEHFNALTPEQSVASIEHRIIMPDGSIRWQQWNNRAFFNESGKVTEYQSVGRDITDRKEIEQLQRESYQQIEQNLQQFAILNDHIRNPLSVIVLLTEMDAGPHTQQILEKSKEIDRIITQLDRGWLESEKIHQFLKKYYDIGEPKK
ncbi:MAG: PAS domain S-box protein [Methanoregula sp.]|jgi:PAS domain S-box-containing protein|nr:PAS domain S-box protein [Methanoregula sp.]